MIIDYELTRNFRASEFVCKHCGATGINHDLVEHLQGLRDIVGPIRITSGYRCAKHPDEAHKPTGPGWHTKGKAADITGPPLIKIWRTLADFPEFTGIGVSPFKNFMHLDTRPLSKGGRVVWAYDRAGQQVKWSGRWEELPQ